jgi:ankyrin repeat protein
MSTTQLLHPQNLLDAVFDGDVEAVVTCLERGADVNCRNEHGETALLWAALFGDESLVSVLLDRGADVNAKDEFGSTALQVACNRDQLNVAGLLLDRGADVILMDREHCHIANEAEKRALVQHHQRRRDALILLRDD